MIDQKNLVIIKRRSCERVDHKAGLHFTLLRIKHECWQQLKSWKKLVKKLHCQTMECLAEAETEGAILALLLHCPLFKQRAAMKAEIMATNECGLLMLPPADGPVGVVGVVVGVVGVEGVVEEGVVDVVGVVGVVEEGVVDVVGVVGQASKALRSFR